MAFVAGSRAALLAARYGARWVVRARVGSYAARAAERARVRAAASSGNRAVGGNGVGGWFKKLFGAGIGVTAAGGSYAAYSAMRPNKRQRTGDYNPPRQGVGAAIVTRSVKRGRKVPYASKMIKLQKAAQKSTLLNFRGINTMGNLAGGNIGYFKLWQAATGTARALPVHCYNLTAVPNEPGNIDGVTLTPPSANVDTTCIVPWLLAVNATAGVDWLPGFAGQTNTPGVTTNLWQVENQVNTERVGAPGSYQWPYIAPGKNSYLDWISAKFMFYGKKKDDTKIRVRLVQFTRDEYCPEYTFNEDGRLSGGDAYERFQDVAQSFVRPLINNPIVTRLKRGKNDTFFRTLYTKYIKLEPKDNSDENDDPAKMQFNLFQRMNRLIDHTDPASFNLTNLPLVTTTADLNDESKIDVPSANYRAQPRLLRSNIYLLIDAWDPKVIDVPTSDFQCSYDLNLRKKFSYE